MSQRNESDEELQELSQQLQQLDQVESELDAQLESARAQKEDVTDAKNALERLETDSSVQVPLGGDTYVRARIEDIDEVIVSLGSDFAAEETREDALSTLDERVDQVEEAIEEISEMHDDVQEDIREIQRRAQQIQQQRAQQQSQQAGGGLGLGGTQD